MKRLYYLLLILIVAVEGCVRNELVCTSTGDMKPLRALTVEDVIPTEYAVTFEGDNIVITGKTRETIQLDITGGFPLVRVTGTVIYRDHGGDVIQIAQYRNGRLHGIVLEWTGCACTPAGGHLYQKTTYQDGRPVGVRTWWYPSGRPWGESRYDSSGKTSVNTVWWENGNKMYEGRYDGVIPEGVHTNWNQDGSLRDIEHWRDGDVVRRITPEEYQREQQGRGYSPPAARLAQPTP